MTKPQDEATTGIGLLNLGWEYVRSAEFLLISIQREQFRARTSEPLEFQFAHGIELLLKSYLRHMGSSLDDVRKIGHDLSRLQESGRSKGLSWSIGPMETETFRALSDRHSKYCFVTRYTRTDQMNLPPIPSLEATSAVARSLMGAIQVVVSPDEVVPRTVRDPVPNWLRSTSYSAEEAARHIPDEALCKYP